MKTNRGRRAEEISCLSTTALISTASFNYATQHLGSDAQPLACGPDPACSAVPSGPQGSPQDWKFSSRGVAGSPGSCELDPVPAGLSRGML